MGLVDVLGEKIIGGRTIIVWYRWRNNGFADCKKNCIVFGFLSDFF